MSRSIFELIPSAREAARAVVDRSPTARRIVYAQSNRRLFSDFFQHDRMLGDRIRVEAYERGRRLRRGAAVQIRPQRPGTSWGQILLRVESQEVAVGDTIRLDLEADPLAREQLALGLGSGLDRPPIALDLLQFTTEDGRQ